MTTAVFGYLFTRLFVRWKHMNRSHLHSFHFCPSFVQVASLSCVRRRKRLHPEWEIKSVVPRSWCRLWPREESRTPDWGCSVDWTVQWNCPPSSTAEPCLHHSHWPDEWMMRLQRHFNAAFTCCPTSYKRPKYVPETLNQPEGTCGPGLQMSKT